MLQTNLNIEDRTLSLRINNTISKFAWTLATALVLSGCASNIPEQIKQPATSNVTPAEARQQSETFLGQSIRWGGEIIAIENKPDHTQIIVLSKPLDKDGEPQSTQKHHGRFIAQVKYFLEPSRYTAGREITVVGKYTHTIERMIGEYPYRYPVVMAEHLHLWPEPVKHDPDYWYDPWYDPWYPWGPWHHYPYYY